MDRLTTFTPGGGLSGVVDIPSDKSISHRAAMIASICDSQVTIKNFLEADDTRSTLAAVKSCGVKVKETGPGEMSVYGAGLRGLAAPPDEEAIFVGNSGTSIRLLPGIFAGQKGKFTLDGDASIRRRPMDRIVGPLRQMGIDIAVIEERFAPITVRGGRVKAIDYEMPVASAQVKSAVLLAGLFADGPTSVTEPAICRDHTEIMLVHAGARVEKEGLKTTVYPAERLSLDEVDIVPDFSSAAFFIVAATIVPDSDITLQGIGVNPTRTGLLDIMYEMGADIVLSNERRKAGEAIADIRVRSASLTGARAGGEITGRAIDELPLVALLGAFAAGDTVVSGAAELKLKESDRIAALAESLTGLGVDIEPAADGFVVHGGTGISGGIFKSRGDHRLAMLGAIAGIASKRGVDVIGFGCVSVSFPDFQKALDRLRNQA